MNRVKLDIDLPKHLADKNCIEVDVQFYCFFDEEDKFYYSYIPAFDVLGAAKTEKESIKSMKIMLQEMFVSTINKGVLEDELRQLGWELEYNKEIKATPPETSDLINHLENFKDYINSGFSFKRKNVEVDIPLPC